MKLLRSYTDFVQRNNLFQPTDKLLLGVSGGVDSVVLSHLTKAAGFLFGIAHCNFQLRGEESVRDEAFVTDLAKTLAVPLYVKRFDTKEYAEEKKLSIQVAARELRYTWFRAILEGKVNPELIEEITGPAVSYTYLLTAHHLGDNVETVLMNFCKGTGIRGLRGMLPKQDKVVRPLLFARREDILEYAAGHQIAWVEDSSNLETKYTRNYFRKVVIPVIEKIYPQLLDNLSESINRFKEVTELYDQSVALHKKKLIEVKGDEVQIPVLKLLKSTPRRTIIYEIIKEYGFTTLQVEEIEKLLTSESGKYITSATHRILRNRGWLVISSLNIIREHIVVINKEEQEAFFDQMRLRVKWLEGESIKYATDNTLATLDAKEVRFPLIIRRWKEGDYFYPLGMKKKKKKLSRFFIDQKLSLTQKEKIWVVESHKKIVWVIGYRIDERFKVTSCTQRALQLSISSL